MDAPSSPKFRLSLLGRFELSGPDGLVDLPNKKLAGLLAYLACTAPTPQRREKLATLLWGSHFEAQARQNLRQAVFRLRRALGQDGLIGDGEEIALAPGLIDCDATRLEALIREGSQASLAAAADLYKDRLLADVSVREETWEDWVRGEQQRLESLALDAMIRHAEQELQSGSPKQAIATANKVIGFSSLREDAHRLVIRALAAAGRRADALKHYEHLVGLLKGELGVEPDVATKALAADLRESQSAAALHPAQPPSTIQVLPPLPDRPSIAVLPFQNMSGDPEQDYFADGMVEEIITALSRIRWLLVIARDSTFTYKNETMDVKRIGRELGVRYLLEGSVRKAENRLRITAQLIDAISGAHLWAHRFEGTLQDVFELQDKVAAAVAGVIEPALQTAERSRSAQRPTEDLTSYDLYLRALSDTLLRDKGRLLHALELLEQAIERDPQYGAALALAARCHSDLFINGWTSDPEGSRRNGLTLARQALLVADDDPSVLANAAHVLGFFGEDIGAALALVDRALQLNPNFARGWVRSGWLRLWAGMPDIAIEHFETSIRLSPRESRVAFLGVGLGHFFAGRLDQAKAMLLQSLQEISTWPPTYRFLASCYAHMGDLDKARDVIARLRDITPVVISNADHWRNPKDREFYLEGLRLAAGEVQ